MGIFCILESRALFTFYDFPVVVEMVTFGVDEFLICLIDFHPIGTSPDNKENYCKNGYTGTE